MILAGVLTGLAILGRANALILLAPLAFAVWKRPRARRSGRRSCCAWSRGADGPPWTIRNYDTLHAFVPVSTQFGSALAGTYNSEARADKVNPASWRTLKRVDDYRPIFNTIRSKSEPVLEKQLRKASIEFIKAHPGYVLTVALLDDAPDARPRRHGLVDPHRGDDHRVDAGWAIAGVICFWVFALLAIFGATTAARAGGAAVAMGGAAADVPGVVFLVVETPRYRTAIDPFIVLLAALTLTRMRRGRTAR